MNDTYTAIMAQKHKDFVACAAEPITNGLILDLDATAYIDGEKVTLKELLLCLTYPLNPTHNEQGTPIAIDEDSKVLLDTKGNLLPQHLS